MESDRWLRTPVEVEDDAARAARVGAGRRKVPLQAAGFRVFFRAAQTRGCQPSECGMQHAQQERGRTWKAAAGCKGTRGTYLEVEEHAEAQAEDSQGRDDLWHDVMHMRRIKQARTAQEKVSMLQIYCLQLYPTSTNA